MKKSLLKDCIKKIISLFLAMLILLLFVSCNQQKDKKTEKEYKCTHEWIEANCSNPKKCSLCDETSGEILPKGHSYVDDKCKYCGIIQLTLDNYEDYLECKIGAKAGYSFTSGYDRIYTDVTCYMEVSGNSHYKYNDVIIEVKYTHYDPDNYMKYLRHALKPSEPEATPYDTETMKVRLNLAGNGENDCTVSVPFGDFESYYKNKTQYLFDHTVYSIVSISGAVQEY